jgi:hypothetical protein
MLLFILIYAFVTLLFGAYMGSFRNRTGDGLCLALFFGPLGLIMVLLMPERITREEPPKPKPSQTPTKPPAKDWSKAVYGE